VVLSGAFTYAATKGQLVRSAYMVAGKAHLIPPSRRYELGLVDRPHYAFGIRSAALEAASLGYPGITVVEFGVAGGNGLLAIEAHASAIERMTGVSVRVVGFDTGTGLSESADYRDLPYLWAAGDFAMDEAALRRLLTRADLIIGDVRETASPFVTQIDPDFPVGFVAFDLDLWSSTVGALDIFRGPVRACLPRTWCYFDDIVATVEDVGELLAIREFNEEGRERRIRHPWMLRANVPFQPAWADQMFQAHFFDHPNYTRLIAHKSTRELPLN
jgi:hypothetical protein